MGKGVVIENLSKSYGNVLALEDVNLEVEEGELFGIIGPDGAGKSTLFRILATLLLPDTGNLTAFGLDIVNDYKEMRDILGYMPGRFSLYQDLSVEENINLFASLFDTTVEEQYELIKEIYSQIEPFKNRRAGQLSGGMKQKLALSCALVHKPRLLLLDEPTTGVDPVSRKEFWGMLERLKKWGITMIVSTPYMDEAILCDRVALIQDARIMKVERPETIVSEFPDKLYGIKSSLKHQLLKDLRSYDETKSAFAFGPEVHYSDRNKTINIDHLRSHLESKGHTDIEIYETDPTIEDCFMDLMLQENE